MKAKVKKTGNVIEVVQIEDIITERGVEHQYVDTDREGCYYVNSELEFIKEAPQKDIDWEQRRYEIAKAVMQGRLSNQYGYVLVGEKNFAGVAANAVEFADALIAELKKGDKK